jgi:PleD family two-component response regulator
MTDQKTHNQGQYEILVVDDTPDHLRFLKLMLEKRGYLVRATSNGPFALESVAARLPDLILLDVIMPEMDGYEVCHHLKSDDRSRNVPVIFISALDQSIDKVKGFRAGGVDYITKPIESEEEAIGRVKTHLALRLLQQEMEKKNSELQKALDEIKTLRGILPICASCKKIRNDEGSWQQMESYIEEHSDAEFSHGICKECAIKLYPQYAEEICKNLES